jgi:8-oxo-dGTP pyrophosphatase MutT (NUDIX family)
MPHLSKVTYVNVVRLAASERAFHPGGEHAEAVEAHWKQAVAANPKYFNGAIVVATDVRMEGGVLSANCHPMQFKEFLYWRHLGKPAWGFVDLFGSAVVRAAQGEIMLGVAASTTMNAGSAYFFGGFIDLRDRTNEGGFDISTSIARELAEETGLDRAAVSRAAGTWVTVSGPMVSLGQVFQSQVPAAALRTAMLAHSAGSAEQELADVLIVRDTSDLADDRILPYTAALCCQLLA